MARYIRVTKKGLDGDPRAEQISQVLERAAQKYYKESLWDSETGLISGAKREVTKAIDICLEQKCDAQEIIDDIDDILFNLFGETLFQEEKGLIFGAREEVVSEIEQLLNTKAEDLDISEMENSDIAAHSQIMSKELGRDVPMQEARWDLENEDPVGYKLHRARIAAGKELMAYKKAKGEDLNSPEELHGELLAIVTKHLGDEFLNEYDEEADGIIDGIQKLLDRLT